MKAICLMKKNRVLALSNKLIRGSYNLTKQEARTLTELFANVRKDDGGFEVIDIPLKNIMSYSSQEEIQKFIKTSVNRQISVRLDDKTLYTINVFQSFIYREGSGFITAKLSESFKDLLFNLDNEKQGFTSFKEKDYLGAGNKGGYVLRVYELVSSEFFLNRNEFIITIEKFREHLNIEPHKYKQSGIFDRDIIKPALKYMNENLNMNVTCEKIRKGRSNHALRFINLDTSIQKKEKTVNMNNKNDVFNNIISFREKNNLMYEMNNQVATPITSRQIKIQYNKLISLGFSYRISGRILTLRGNIISDLKKIIPVPENITNPKAYIISVLKEINPMYKKELEAKKIADTPMERRASAR